MLKLKVNEIEVEVEEGLTVLQACEKAGVEYTLYNGEEEEDEDMGGPDTELEQVKDMLKTKVPNKQSVSASSVPQDILEKVENVEISPSLLAPQNEPEPAPSSNLLGRTE